MQGGVCWDGVLVRSGPLRCGRQVQASSDRMRSVVLGCVIAGMAI